MKEKPGGNSPESTGNPAVDRLKRKQEARYQAMVQKNLEAGMSQFEAEQTAGFVQGNAVQSVNTSTNLGNRPLGLKKAVADSVADQTRDKRTSSRYVPNTPTFAAPRSDSLWDKALGSLNHDDDFQRAQESRISNASMGLPSLGLGLPAQDGTSNAAGSFASNIVYKPALAALQGWDWAWQNIVAEPLATVALATNEKNPAFKDGIQPGDAITMWKAAREAANDASWGTAVNSNQFFLAAASSPLTRTMPVVGQLFGLTDMIRPILAGVDPFDPTSIQEARDNYVAYNFVTGSYDFGLNFLPIPMGKGIGAVRRVTGLSTKFDILTDLPVIKHDWEMHKLHLATDGAEGYETNIGRQIMQIADSSDIGYILERPLVKNMTGAAKGKLARAYTLTEDPEAVLDIYTASLGDTQAIQRLLDTGNADLVYGMANVGDGILGITSGGGRYFPKGKAKHYYDQAYRDAVQRTEWSRAIYSTFIAEDEEAGQVFTVLGDWMPMGGNARILPSIASRVATAGEKARESAADLRAALKTGNEEYLPAWAEKVIQTTDDGPIIHLVSIRPGALQWSTSNRPLNIISFSGSRPDDPIEEAYAVMNQVDSVRFGEQVPVRTSIDKNGKTVVETISAADFREKHISNITRAMTMGGDETAKAFRALEEDLVTAIMLKEGLSKEQVAKIIQGFREKADLEFANVRTNGYFIDDRTKRKVEFDPKTKRQLRESYYTMPINQIEAAIKAEAHHLLRMPAQRGGDAAREAFEFGSTLFRTNMLVKPGYTFRNSILEPWVTTAIAHGALLLTADGAEMMIKGIGNFARNNLRRAKRVTAGSVDAVKSVRLTSKQRGLVNEYMTWKELRDQLTAEIQSRGIHPAPTAQIKLQQVQDELNVVNGMLSLVTRDLVDQGVVDAAGVLGDPSVFRLTEEVNEMLNIAENPLTSQAVDRAEKAALDAADANDTTLFEYWSARAEILKEIEKMQPADRADLITSLKTLQKDTRRISRKRVTADNTDHYGRVAEATRRMEELQDKLLEVRGQAALVKQRRARRAKPFLQGEGRKTVTLHDGQSVTYNEGFGGPYGSAYRADSSSAVTNRMAMDTSAHHTTMLAMVSSRFHRGRTGSVKVEDPHYFEELHYIASRHFAGEELFTLIATKSKAEVLEWASSPKGKRYFAELGVSGKKYMKDINEAYYVFNKLFPTKEAQDLVASGREFSVAELQMAVSKPGPDGEIPRLGDIVGQEIDYVVPTSTFHQAGSMYRRALDRLWDYIATQPETRLARWPYYVRQFDQELVGRMNTLAKQGVTVDVAVANAQRRAAHVATLSNLEKTFYNIRRYNNVAYTSRFLMAFPGAFFNSIRRYGYYLPTRYPGNMATLMNLTNSAFESMAVDENGVKTDLQNAKYLLIPGTGKPRKDKYGLVADDGVRIPIDALTRIFLDNPGRSWLTAISVDSLLNMRPELDLLMKKYLPDYATAFLQNAEPPTSPGGEWSGGPQPGSPVGAIIGSLAANWQKTAVNWWQGEGSEKYKFDWGWSWQHVQAEKLRRGDTSPVTVEEVNSVVDGWTGLRFLVQFASPTSYQVDAPGQLERDVWFRVREDNPDLSFEDQREKYYQILGSDADDPVTAAENGAWGEPYTVSTSKDPYGMGANYTVEARNAVKKHPNLAETLGGIDKELVGLLAVGSGGSFSRAVYNNMAFDKPYESADEPFRTKKSRADYLTDWEISKGWDEWSTSKRRYVEARKTAVASGNREWVKRIDDSWDEYVYGPGGIKERRPEWWVKKSGTSGAPADQVAGALELMRLDDSFMADRGNDDDWQSVFTMLQRREELLAAKRGVGNTKEEREYKNSLEDYFVNFYNEKSLDNPLLMDLWDRYFASEFEEN